MTEHFTQSLGSDISKIIACTEVTGRLKYVMKDFTRHHHLPLMLRLVSLQLGLQSTWQKAEKSAVCANELAEDGHAQSEMSSTRWAMPILTTDVETS